ncbi:MAG: mycothiol transferase [Actinomycetota bacterium]
MSSANLLVDAFGRVNGIVQRVVKGLGPEQLSFRVDQEANSIAWLIWHLSRIQDDHIAGVAGTEQAYTSAGWADRLALPFDSSDTGYGHTSDKVSAVRVESAKLLTGYHDAVFERTIRFVEPLTDTDLARIVDESWDPPVTLSVRLVSVISDNLQHAGQAAFVRGIIERS